MLVIARPHNVQQETGAGIRHMGWLCGLLMTRQSQNDTYLNQFDIRQLAKHGSYIGSLRMML